MRIGQLSPELRARANEMHALERVREIRHRAGLHAVERMGFPYIRTDNSAAPLELPNTPYFFTLVLTGRTVLARHPRVKLFGKVYRYSGDLAEHLHFCELCSNGHGNCCTDWAALTRRPIKL